MRCNDVEEMLSAYADGEIGAREAAELKAHLVRCGSCAARLEALQALQSKLGEMMSAGPGANLSDLVIASLPKPRVPVVRRWAWAFAALALAAVLSWQAMPRVGVSEPERSSLVRDTPTESLVEMDRPQIASRQEPQKRPLDQETTVRKERMPLQPSAQVKNYGRRMARTPKQKRPSSGIMQTQSPVKEPSSNEVQPEPIRMAVTSRSADGGTETTFEVTTDSLTVFRARTREVEIARDDSAVAIERPPLEVVKNSPPILTGVNGG